MLAGTTTQEPLLDGETSDQALLSFKQATKESAGFAISFALSRLAAAGQNFGNGIIIARLNVTDAVAAAPIMFMMQYSFIGTARGALSAINTMTSNLNGQQKFEQMGPTVNQGLLLGTLLGIPTTVLFFTSPHWLGLLGMDSSVAKQAGEYLCALSYGILPSYWSFVDQNFLLSIQRSVAPIVLNTLLVGLAMAIGYPLAIAYNNLAGLGYGVSVSAALTFIVGRCYLYMNKTEGILDRERYNLFSISINSGTTWTSLLQLCFPTSLQALSEWLPTTLITLITARGKNADEILAAEEPSMQILIVINQILLGLGTAATISVANALGRARAYTVANNVELTKRWQENARTIGYAELAVTTGVILPPALLCTLYPHPIVKLFSDKDQNYPLAESMLRVTGATFIIDGIRNTMTGALLGRKKSADNFFTSITNLLITAAAATTLGYFMQAVLGPLSFFLCRMMGIAITASLLVNRWEQRSKTTESSGLANNSYQFWRRSSRSQATVESKTTEYMPALTHGADYDENT